MQRLILVRSHRIVLDIFPYEMYKILTYLTCYSTRIVTSKEQRDKMMNKEIILLRGV